MRLLLLIFLTLSVSARLTATVEPAMLQENQLSPDDFKARETLRLTSLLKSPEEEVRLDTVIRLSALRTPGAAGALASAASDQSERVRAAAIVGIGNCGDTAFAPIVIARLLEDKSIPVRKSAAYALGKLRYDQSVAALTSALHDKDLEVRGAAAVSLGEYEGPAAITALIAALSEKSEFVQERAARALGRYGPASASAVSTLMKLLTGDAVHGVKLHAAIALGQIGDRSAVPALEKAARDKDPYVSRAALEALKTIAEGR
jgi:HEAT repeat protein